MKLVAIIIFFSSSLFSQITFEKTSHDFGSINSNSDRFIDIVVTNKTLKKEFLLSVKKPPNVVYLVNGQFMEKDGNLTIRLQVNPQKKGHFTYEVQIYTSDKDKPTLIKLTGNLSEESSNQSNPFQACPDFNSRPESRHASDFEMTVITIDQETKQLIEQASVSVLQDGMSKGLFLTNKKGEIKQKIPLGFTYFYITHPEYITKELGGYVNFQRNKIIVELEKKKVKKTTEEIKQEKQLEKQLVNKLKQEVVVQATTSIALENTVKFEEIDPSLFDDKNFKPINVTFVLDISASMQAGEKMELMKFCLYQITDMLRKQDKISIVTYSTETKIDLPTTSGIEKEKIKKLIESLRAGGLTAGGAGIKLGYKQTLSSLIPSGTNQIIVITDGAFNRNSDDYKNHIEKYKKKGINMTVVGILNSELDKKSMEKVAELGGGKYIPIYKLSDAMDNLKQEIRFISFKK